ncbi:FAD-binding oxidoreductase [Micromonospora cathayae]|uniref:FAD-dependent oxidoreductase n=1 Tax=Micromonospora cathayae TaxID=3028804 RepID=A0ABY7ZU37_9ACTN|nr:FAD-dependent oxidoreductase [Micromonospora sp. HUAS 3]WDZ86537.1 FAD-dependent oxidoreductase [Micromonospora sp. HUAS 3]
MPTRRSVLRTIGGLTVAAAAGTAVSGHAAAGPVSGDPWRRLDDLLTGRLVRPTHAGYAAAQRVYLGEYSTANPQAIAYCRTVDDVRACLRFVRDEGIELHTRSGGHNLAGWSTGPGLVVDLSRFHQTRVGPETVHVGPGVRSIDALTALAGYGRQIVTGTCPTVCPGGFISGGGVGHQTRKFGTGSDRLVSALVVLADGRVVRTSADREPDLFWALRGGGGGTFGIVLDFEVRPIEAPYGVHFDTVWPWDRAAEVLEAWQKWSVSSSHDLGSALLVVLPDAAPGATPVVMLNGAYWGPRAELEAGLAAMAAEAGTGPVTSQLHEGTYHEVMQRVYGCGQLTVRECHLEGQNPDAALPRGGFLRERTRIFDRPVTGTVLTDALALFDDRQAGQTRLLSLTATGGRANEVDRAETAYWHRNAQFLTGFAALAQHPAPPEEQESAVRWVQRGFRTLDPVSTGESYLNFPDLFLTDWQRAYHGDNYTRLLQVKRQYDPGNLFHHPQSVGS